MKQLNYEEFKTKIFDFEKETEWKFLGNKPTVISFSASWCSPCKKLTPILEELSVEYEGKLDIYKVDVDEENQLSSIFGIQSVPTMLFIPMTGQPAINSGMIPKEALKNVIKEVLNIE